MLIDFFKSTKKSSVRILDISALASGLLLPFAFAPYEQSWLVYIVMAWMCLLWLHSLPGRAFWRGWLFGLGQFVFGVHWIFYSLYFHGGSPVFLAVLIVFLLAAYLALFPALAGFLAQRFFNVQRSLKLILIIPLCWLITEWLRGYFLTGFPWLQLGYSQIDMPVAGYATLFGGLGVGFVAVFCSALLALIIYHKKYLKVCLPVLLLVWLVGFGLMRLDWVNPAGDEINVSLIQGNIAQKDKWRSYMYRPTLNMYRQLTQQHWSSDVIIWPETAIPDYQHQVTEYLQRLKSEAEKHDKDVLLGLFIREQNSRRYFNSVISLRDGVYQKRHLVPLGEYFPFR
ncbi:MAG: apolipoprotein N-acyltransferase, partial [Gammaproteobacteria bacterium]|nr:apolipoprotein N-acyltransferase [Gammaproteobacteria bacterium]